VGVVDLPDKGHLQALPLLLLLGLLLLQLLDLPQQRPRRHDDLARHILHHASTRHRPLP
jgi:hypothetical protein